MDLSFPRGLSGNDGVMKDIYLGAEFQMYYLLLLLSYEL